MDRLQTWSKEGSVKHNKVTVRKKKAVVMCGWNYCVWPHPILSHPIACCPITTHGIPSNFIPYHPNPTYEISSYLLLFHFILYFPIPSHSIRFPLSHSTPCYPTPSHTIPPYLILFHFPTHPIPSFLTKNVITYNSFKEHFWIMTNNISFLLISHLIWLFHLLWLKQKCQSL